MVEQVVPCCLSYQGLLLLLVFFLTLYVGTCFLFTDAFVPDLDKKAVFITGCDTGFGFELAKKLDRLGLRVFASCLTREGQAKLTNLCSKHLTTLRMDVTVEDDVKNALEFVNCRLPAQGLWAVVNNAGILMPGFVEWITMDDMKKVVDVNLWGTISVTRAFLPLLKQTKGRIVNVASAFGIVSVPGAVAYSISKYGVEAFCDGLRREIKHLGVTVHIIEPGFFSTNLSDLDKNGKTMEELWHHLDEETRESYGNEFFEQMISKGERMYRLMISPHNHKVVDAMANAALCRRPKLRYSVGVDHKIFWRPVSFLPAEIQDLFF